MRKQRHNYTPEEKVAILKRHLIDRVPVSDLCDEYQLQPKLFYEWQKLFFENGASAFARSQISLKSVEANRVQQLEEKSEAALRASAGLVAEALLPIWAGDTSVALFQQISEQGVLDAMNVVGAFNSNDIVKSSDPSTIGNVSWIVYHYSFPQNDINTWLTDNHKKFFEGDGRIRRCC